MKSWVLPLLLLMAALNSSCDEVMGCGNEVVQATVSPSGARTAIAFVRDCGATTGYSTQVSIVRGQERDITGGGNAFIVEGRPELEMRWLSESELLLGRPGSGRIFRQETQVDGVALKYEY